MTGREGGMREEEMKGGREEGEEMKEVGGHGYCEVRVDMRTVRSGWTCVL